jgi:subtilisin family serine protease
VGEENQLTYYSNYGPRIDFAAPGGARKFNVPSVDRGGCEGWPFCGADSVLGGSSVSDGFNAWEAFSTTSNWGIEIPCVIFTGFPGFTDNQCYTSIQGTSMATPHVSAALALLASKTPGLRHQPKQLLDQLRERATMPHNLTPPVSATDKSATDRTGATCSAGYCHLGGHRISDGDAYGHGLVSLGDE